MPHIPTQHHRGRRDGDGLGGLRHGTATYEGLRTQAVALRRAALRPGQIRYRSKVGTNDLLNRLLDGEPHPGGGAGDRAPRLPLRQDDPQAPQPHDGAQERRHRLPRLPHGRRSARSGPVPSHRGLVVRHSMWSPRAWKGKSDIRPIPGRLRASPQILVLLMGVRILPREPCWPVRIPTHPVGIRAGSPPPRRAAVPSRREPPGILRVFPLTPSSRRASS